MHNVYVHCAFINIISHVEQCIKYQLYIHDDIRLYEFGKLVIEVEN